MVGRKGLEPLRIKPLILSQSCLPVPASAHINNKRGLQLIRICLLPPTPQFIGGHLTGSVARRSTFFIFRIPLVVRVAGLEPARAYAQQILSLWCLPIPPCPHKSKTLFADLNRSKSFTNQFFYPIKLLDRAFLKLPRIRISFAYVKVKFIVTPLIRFNGSNFHFWNKRPIN